MAKATQSPWKRLSEQLKLDKTEVTQLYIYALFSGIVSLSLPLGIQSVITFIQGGQITTSWIILVILVIAGVILAGILQIMQLRITENIQQRIFVRYTFDFAFRFPRIHRLALAGKVPVELINRFFDIISLQKGLAKVLLDFSSALLQIVFGLLVLSFYHPFYIAFSLALVLLLYFVFKPIIRRGFETSLDESGYKYKTAFWLQEIARADWSFRLAPNGNHALTKLNEHAENYISTRESHFKVLWRQFIWMIAIKALIVASLLGLGGYLVIDQQMNLGQFVAAEILILLILGAVEKIIILLETLYDVFTSLEKLGQVTDLPTAFEESAVAIDPLSLFPMEIINTQSAEANVILRVEKGEHIFLKGGKQQGVTQLFRQLIDPSCSEYLKPRWNNAIPKKEQLGSALEQIGWFTKGTHLFDGTLEENILMGRNGLNASDLETVLEITGMTGFVRRQNAGYDTRLWEGCRLLSEAEKERILLARALIHRPAVLLLSFLGSALSAQEQSELIQSIAAGYSETTIVFAGENAPSGNWKTIEL